MKKVTLSELNIPEFIRNRDFDNCVLSREDVIELVKSPEMDHIAILGGDVVKWNHTLFRYDYTYDNWYSERRGPLEKFEEYAARSREETIAYISSYPSLPEEVMLRLTLSREVTAGL